MGEEEDRWVKLHSGSMVISMVPSGFTVIVIR